MAEKPYPLWDAPVRVIHWLIVLLLPASWWTAEEGHLDVHQWLGLTLLVAVLTRLVWGFIGSPQARFSDFLRGPGAVLAYWRGTPSATPGHNPAGAWSVLLLLSLLLLQALTGTVNSDDVLFTGPFHYALDSDLRDALSAWHEPLFKITLGFIALHVASVAYYEWRKARLVMPMLRGSAPGRHGTGPARSWLLALGVAVFWAALIWALIQVAPEPPSTYYW